MMRSVGYLWTLPVTLIGLIFVILIAITGGTVRVRGGVIEAQGGIAVRLLRGGRIHSGGAAGTLGHVILARDAECLERSRDHERKHVRQFERWGPLLLPAYWIVAGWLWFRGLHPYLDHPFEPPPK
jgi:hypothetical protein